MVMETFGSHQYPGRLFIVEGVDGSGKSTQIALLRQWLISEGYTVFFSEWNSSPLVKKTTSRGKKKQLLTPTTFSLIHATDFADRTEHLVPERMAHRIVDLLEFVDTHDQQRNLASVVLRRRQPDVQIGMQRVSIGEAGQSVVFREVPNSFRLTLAK